MEPQEVIVSFQKTLREYAIPLCFGGFSFISIIIAIILLVKSIQTPQPIEVVMGESTASASISSKTILIDISGGVKKPGVYHLAGDARIEDAIEIAGGLSEEASLEIIGKSLNRAQKLKDGAKIYIPTKGDEVKTSHINTEGSKVETSHNVINDEGGSQIMSINNATQQELETLAGIGPATAQKIISGRPYANLDELVNKKVLGQKTFDKIRSQISL